MADKIIPNLTEKVISTLADLGDPLSQTEPPRKAVWGIAYDETDTESTEKTKKIDLLKTFENTIPAWARSGTSDIIPDSKIPNISAGRIISVTPEPPDLTPYLNGQILAIYTDLLPNGYFRRVQRNTNFAHGIRVNAQTLGENAGFDITRTITFGGVSTEEGNALNKATSPIGVINFQDDPDPAGQDTIEVFIKKGNLSSIDSTRNTIYMRYYSDTPSASNTLDTFTLTKGTDFTDSVTNTEYFTFSALVDQSKVSDFRSNITTYNNTLYFRFFTSNTPNTDAGQDTDPLDFFTEIELKDFNPTSSRIIAEWAKTGNTDEIPDAKIPANIARDSELPDVSNFQTQAQVDTRIETKVLDWAETGNTDTIPDNKIPANIARDSELPDISNFVTEATIDSKIVAGVKSGVLDWAETGNTDLIPDNKIPPSKFILLKEEPTVLTSYDDKQLFGILEPTPHWKRLNKITNIRHGIRVLVRDLGEDAGLSFVGTTYGSASTEENTALNLENSPVGKINFRDEPDVAGQDTIEVLIKESALSSIQRTENTIYMRYYSGVPSASNDIATITLRKGTNETTQGITFFSFAANVPQANVDNFRQQYDGQTLYFRFFTSNTPDTEQGQLADPLNIFPEPSLEDFEPSIKAEQIPDLSTSKITSGTFDPARIPDLPANKITGTFDPDRIPGLDANKITTGILDIARIPEIPNNKLANETTQKILGAFTRYPEDPLIRVGPITTPQAGSAYIPSIFASFSRVVGSGVIADIDHFKAFIFSAGNEPNQLTVYSDNQSQLTDITKVRLNGKEFTTTAPVQQFGATNFYTRVFSGLDFSYISPNSVNINFIDSGNLSVFGQVELDKVRPGPNFIFDNTQIDARIADWAKIGNTDEIPTNKLGTGTADSTKVLFGDGTWKNAPTGLTQSQVDARVQAGVLDWAETGNTDLIPTTKIPDLDADKVTSGKFDPARLGTGTADNTKILYGDSTWKDAPSEINKVNIYDSVKAILQAGNNITITPADSNSELTIASTATGTGGLNQAQVDARVQAGVLDWAETGNTDTIPDAKIPNLATSKVTSGTFDIDRIPVLSTAKIPNLDASKITSGRFATARLGTGTADNTKVLYGDGTWKDAPSGGTGSSSFTGLTDTPSSYTGQAGKFLKVNSGASALEFTDEPTGGGSSDFIALDAIPTDLSSYSDKQVLRVINPAPGTWQRVKQNTAHGHAVKFRINRGGTSLNYLYGFDIVGSTTFGNVQYADGNTNLTKEQSPIGAFYVDSTPKSAGPDDFTVFLDIKKSEIEQADLNVSPIYVVLKTSIDGALVDEIPFTKRDDVRHNGIAYQRYTFDITQIRRSNFVNNVGSDRVIEIFSQYSRGSLTNNQFDVFIEKELNEIDIPAISWAQRGNADIIPGNKLPTAPQTFTTVATKPTDLADYSNGEVIYVESENKWYEILVSSENNVIINLGNVGGSDTNYSVASANFANVVTNASAPGDYSVKIGTIKNESGTRDLIKDETSFGLFAWIVEQLGSTVQGMVLILKTSLGNLDNNYIRVQNTSGQTGISQLNRESSNYSVYGDDSDYSMTVASGYTLYSLDTNLTIPLGTDLTLTLSQTNNFADANLIPITSSSSLKEIEFLSHTPRRVTALPSEDLAKEGDRVWLEADYSHSNGVNITPQSFTGTELDPVENPDVQSGVGVRGWYNKTDAGFDFGEINPPLPDDFILISDTRVYVKRNEQTNLAKIHIGSLERTLTRVPQSAGTKIINSPDQAGSEPDIDYYTINTGMPDGDWDNIRFETNEMPANFVPATVTVKKGLYEFRNNDWSRAGFFSPAVNTNRDFILSAEEIIPGTKTNKNLALADSDPTFTISNPFPGILRIAFYKSTAEADLQNRYTVNIPLSAGADVDSPIKLEIGTNQFPLTYFETDAGQAVYRTSVIPSANRVTSATTINAVNVQFESGVWAGQSTEQKLLRTVNKNALQQTAKSINSVHSLPSSPSLGESVVLLNNVTIRGNGILTVAEASDGISWGYSSTLGSLTGTQSEGNEIVSILAYSNSATTASLRDKIIIQRSGSKTPSKFYLNRVPYTITALASPAGSFSVTGLNSSDLQVGKKYSVDMDYTDSTDVFEAKTFMAGEIVTWDGIQWLESGLRGRTDEQLFALMDARFEQWARQMNRDYIPADKIGQEITLTAYNALPSKAVNQLYFVPKTTE